MATKYIVNNLSGQTINGNITVNGNLNVTGVTTGSLVTYKALLTQTGSVSGTNLDDFNGSLIIGETYTITNYAASDDFSNIANVQSGNINETNCVFIATGGTPSVWSYGSELTSSGNLIVDVLENSLGYDLEWYNDFQPVYFGFPTTTGLIYNNFPRDKTSVFSQIAINGVPFFYDYIRYYSMPASFSNKDDVIVLAAWDLDLGGGVNNTLYFTPVEVKMKLDTDTTPITINGVIDPSFPFSYASIELICDQNYMENFVTDGTTVNDVNELITQLNSYPTTNFLGTYSDDGMGGINLTMPRNLVNRFCANGTLTFLVYND